MSRNFKSAMITGGLGFIGSQFVKDAILLNLYKKIVIIDNETYAANLNLKEYFRSKGVEIYNLDINSGSIEAIINVHEIDLIVNFAAESHVTNSINDPSLFIKTNINGTFNLIDSARMAWGNRRDVLFHQVSTDEVYGSVRKNPISELKKYRPGNPYSASKASADMIVESFHNTYGIPVTFSHGCNTFGYNQNEEKFIPLNIKRLVSGKPMYLHMGDHYRQWIPVEFHTLSIRSIISFGKIGQHYNVNLDGEFCYNNNFILSLISKFSGMGLSVQFIPDRPGNDYKYHSNSNKLLIMNHDVMFGHIKYFKDTFEIKFQNTVKFYMDKFKGEQNA